MILTLLEINYHARGARSDDVGALRYNAMSYLPVVAGIEPISPSDRNKCDRGFANHATARLLCPRNMLDEFDADRVK